MQFVFCLIVYNMFQNHGSIGPASAGPARFFFFATGPARPGLLPGRPFSGSVQLAKRPSLSGLLQPQGQRLPLKGIPFQAAGGSLPNSCIAEPSRPGPALPASKVSAGRPGLARFCHHDRCRRPGPPRPAGGRSARAEADAAIPNWDRPTSNASLFPRDIYLS